MESTRLLRNTNVSIFDPLFNIKNLKYLDIMEIIIQMVKFIETLKWILQILGGLNYGFI